MGSSHVDLLTGTLLVQSLAARLKERVVATPRNAMVEVEEVGGAAEVAAPTA